MQKIISAIKNRMLQRRLRKMKLPLISIKNETSGNVYVCFGKRDNKTDPNPANSILIRPGETYYRPSDGKVVEIVEDAS